MWPETLKFFCRKLYVVLFQSKLLTPLHIYPATPLKPLNSLPASWSGNFLADSRLLLSRYFRARKKCPWCDKDSTYELWPSYSHALTHNPSNRLFSPSRYGKTRQDLFSALRFQQLIRVRINGQALLLYPLQNLPSYDILCGFRVSENCSSPISVRQAPRTLSMPAKPSWP